MFQLVKKDFLTLSKSKSDLLELLFMPFILIAILGFALGSVLMGNGSLETFHIGIVSEQTTKEDLERFEQALIAENYPETAIVELRSVVEDLNVASLLQGVLEDKNFSEILVIEEFTDVAAAEAAMNNEDIVGFLRFPAQFDYEMWKNILLDEENPAVIDMEVLVADSIYSNIFESIVATFVEEFNFETSIARVTETEVASQEPIDEWGAIIPLSVEEPVTPFQYYTIGMGVMFALSTAPIIATRAFQEKEQHVFSRIMLSGTKPITYLLSKLISGTLITIVQLAILFLLSALLFNTFSNRGMDFWLDMLATTGLYALLVGAVSSLLTSLSLYANNNSTVGFFASFVSLLAFLGGSFIPVEQFSEALKVVGNWTPNGATMTAYLQLMQGFELGEVFPLLARVVGMTFIFLFAAWALFPQRRLA